MRYRPLANTGIRISEVALGCWPMAGMTTPGVTEADGIAAIRACFELGVNHLDTAYMYGVNGESERLIAKALGNRRAEMIIATKGGFHWATDGSQVHDASPVTLRRECEESLRRLDTDRVELYYLHAPDPKVPLAESAGEMKRLKHEGKVLALGVSNVNLEQLEQFAAECPLAAFQPPYNMLQREIESDTLPWCREHGVSVLVYWPLMKGLFAGKIRPGALHERDNRRKYPQYQGEELQKNLELVEKLRLIAQDAGHTVVELVINWILRQPGITCAVCGARRPEQIRENAGGSDWELTDNQLDAIEEAIKQRGPAKTRSAV
ncbi:MAG: aldo/keto reductase [Thermoguttaceae bacterium]|jgi:aryl-alcohol dehydrogenase-like predicted oxidoreductase